MGYLVPVDGLKELGMDISNCRKSYKAKFALQLGIPEELQKFKRSPSDSACSFQCLITDTLSERAVLVAVVATLLSLMLVFSEKLCPTHPACVALLPRWAVIVEAIAFHPKANPVCHLWSCQHGSPNHVGFEQEGMVVRNSCSLPPPTAGGGKRELHSFHFLMHHQ